MRATIEHTFNLFNPLFLGEADPGKYLLKVTLTYKVTSRTDKDVTPRESSYSKVKKGKGYMRGMKGKLCL